MKNLIDNTIHNAKYRPTAYCIDVVSEFRRDTK